MFYFVKTPGWLKKIYSDRVWEIATTEKQLFLTFDDGPHPAVTPFVLDELQKVGAKATFFCIGKNVVAHPEIYSRILDEGHAVGNHTFNHLNGWKTGDAIYLDDIAEAKKYIDSKLFRPPYGRISSFQQKQLKADRFELKTIMWTVLSGDFDTSVNNERCLQNVVLHAKEGSVIVFHDSEKAGEKVKFALPRVLNYFSGKGFSFEKLSA
ncbi:polysaccharide deacetylase family protein [Ferruginibacter sp. HRS2-29]|uniref:polysaccharide deacetylase family protein n=1 Tax=Ferruginibacter sp. HRS2-29 TaxID=2487334 RepID=UPI0020CF6BCE|nr:polysaccharide deacetylase family protein [Ferruginibacter sp. HRS2-29]MCP9751666.1 polysaccharide deacetylase family protein [Ferruginibacter sp. HRS2-29]